MNTTQASLLLRIKDRRDKQAWTEFDAIYRPLLQRFALSCGLGEADAEDVVQHCMESVQKHIEEFRYDPTRGRFRGWLRTIASNRIRTLRRRRIEASAGSGAFDNIPNDDTSPEDAFARLWMEEHLKHCLDRVRSETDDRSFRAFVKYVIDEHPVSEVCRHFEIDRARLYKFKWRITQRLQQHMQEILGSDGKMS